MNKVYEQPSIIMLIFNVYDNSLILITAESIYDVANMDMQNLLLYQAFLLKFLQKFWVWNPGSQEENNFFYLSLGAAETAVVCFGTTTIICSIVQIFLDYLSFVSRS